MTEVEMSQDRGVVAWVHDRSPFGLFTTDSKLAVTGWNRWLENHSGRTRKEVMGRDLVDLYPEIVDRKMDRYFNEALEGRNAVLSQVLHGYLFPIPTDADADPPVNMPQSAIISPLILGGQICGTVGYIEDVSERIKREKELIKQVDEEKRLVKKLKSSDEALRKEKEFSESLIDTAQVIILVLDTEGRIVHFNPYMEGLCGYKLNEVQGRDWFSTFLPEQNHDRTREVFRTAVSDIKTQGNINPIVAKDGRGIITEWYDKTLKDAAGNTIGLLAIGQDITSRKQAEEALQESEKRFHTFIDFTHDWEYWIAQDGHHIYVSPSCERITGYAPDAFINDPGLLEKIVHPDDHSTIVNHLGEEQGLEKLPSIDYRIITRSGQERWINHVCQAVYDADGTYLGRRGSNRDVTQQKQMEEELLKTKKLESLGVLAGGIAHDFNNLMSAVAGYISLARMEMKPGSKGFKNLVEAEKASIQTKGLTARLITFSKGGGPIKETVSIGDLVKNSVGFSLKGSGIDARFSIPADISPAEVDEDQMKQVIYNIVTNAQEAMVGQGTINVSCENVNIGGKDALTLKDGKYVKISIKDQGVGISEEDLIKIFDPYFSTKDMGTQKGMGLGLAVSDSIVKQHKGLITVESELGTGTTLYIYLPASVKEIVEAAPVKKPAPEISVTQGGKILVMDDEELLRDVTKALLTRLGYNAEVAVEGVEAIEMYRKAMESEKPFDMVILDLTNKVGMGGAETMAKLLEIDSDVKAIVATGYSNDPIISNFREHGFRGALPKPFTLDQLKTALHDAVAGE